MSDTVSKSEENPNPVFHHTPRTLLELASIRVALHIWLEKFDELYPVKTVSYVNITELEFNTEMLTKVPSTVRKMIESWFHPIANELDTWFRESKQVLCHLQCEQIYSRFDLVVFGGSGTIHFKDTMANYLEDDSLSNVTKFEMACVFCVEDKVDVFWPLVCDTLCIDDLRFDFNFMMYYWICRKRGELNRIPLGEFDRIEHLMIDKCSWHPICLAVEYFLTLLDPDDRLDQINRLFRSDNASYKCARYLLPFFEASVQREIINLRPIHILATFIEYHRLFEYASQVWLYIRDFITGEQYYSDIIQRFIDVRNRDRIGQVFDYVYFEMILAEIWSNSPDHLKQHILNFYFPHTLLQIATYRGNLLKNSSRDVRFVLAMVADADVDSRKNFWTESWQKWVVGVPSTQFEQLMTLCLVNTEAIDEFKKTIKDTDVFKKYCDTLVKRGYYNELNDFLTGLCSDQQQVLDIKMNLLAANDYWTIRIFKSDNVEQIRECGEFIDNMLSNDVLAKDFKNRLILSENSLEMLRNKIERNNLLDVEIIVDVFVSPEKHVELKEILWAVVRDMFTKGELRGFDEIDCQDFVMWCANDDNLRIENYVKSLPIDDIFEAASCNCLAYEPFTMYACGRFWNKCTFKDLNKFLEWYFESKCERENFKRERVEYYKAMQDTDIERLFRLDKGFVIETMEMELLIEN